jgi:hypothetical protein
MIFLTEQKLYNAKVLHYRRNINLFVSSKKFPATQHWGLVIEYLDEDLSEGLPKKFIYHADNVDGKLIATAEEFTSKFTDDYDGATLTILEENAKVSKVIAESFCKKFNATPSEYTMTENNCQKFVAELLIHLEFSSSLPVNAQKVTEKSLKSSRSGSLYLLSDWITRFPDVTEEAIKFVAKAVDGLFPDRTVKTAFFGNANQSLIEGAAKNLTGGKAVNLVEEATEEIWSLPPNEKLWFNESFTKYAVWHLLHVIAGKLTENLAKACLFKNFSEEKRKIMAFGLSKAVGLSIDVASALLSDNTIVQVVSWWLASILLAYLIEKVTSTFTIIYFCKI